MGKSGNIRWTASVITFCMLIVLLVNTAAPSAALSDDNYEENDTYETAYDLTAYEQTWLSEIAGYGIQSDVDWYKIYVSPGFERLIINLTFTDSEGDIDIKVYQASGELVASGVSVTDNEYINQIVPSTGILYVGIYYDDAGNTYDLWWDDVAPDSFGDNYEPNDSLETAFDLTTHNNTWLAQINGSATQTDEDWYQITAFPGRARILLDLRFDDSSGDIDMQLYDSTETLLRTSSSYTDNEFIDYTVPAAGNYFVRIYQENMANEYDFRYESRDPLQTDDHYEENDNLGSAYNLRAHEQMWLSTIAGSGIQLDEDWFEVEVTSGNERLVVDVRFQDNQGDIDVTIFDSTEEQLASSTSVTDNEYLDFILPSAGIYFIQIDDYNSPGNFYDLWWAQLDSGDITSPIITEVIHIPEHPNGKNTINIQATVTDNTGLSFVNVIYREDGGRWQGEEMTEIGDDGYSASLGIYELHAEIEYFILAIDVSSHQNMAINDNYEEYYRIKVARKIPGFPTLSMVIFSTAGILWLALTKVKKKRL